MDADVGHYGVAKVEKRFFLAHYGFRRQSCLCTIERWVDVPRRRSPTSHKCAGVANPPCQGNGDESVRFVVVIVVVVVEHLVERN